MSVLDVDCAFCGAKAGERCFNSQGVPTGPHARRRRWSEWSPEERAAIEYRAGRKSVELWDCPLCGLTTEARDGRCRVSLATNPDAHHCDEPVTGPYRATLDDPAPASRKDDAR